MGGKKTLILTEKPSVARDFAKALRVPSRKGWMENDEYIVAWAVGHLVELLEPGEYDSKWKRWSLASLPIIPEEFRYKPIEKTKKQLKLINGFFSSGRVGKIVIATDAGREGEVIARTILLSSGVKAEKLEGREDVLRFWTSQALTPSVVKAGMNSLKPAGDYDRLWRAGQARQIADWLVGMNATRSATKRMDDLFSIGRVQTAVLALLVDRRRERENFKPEPYWLLKAFFENPKGQWWGSWFDKDQTRFLKEEDAKAVQEKIENRRGLVVSAKKQKKKQPPPLLYSLTDLQRDANIRFGFTAKKTLGIAQGLYENKKCLSYPRTEAQVLGSKNVELVKKIVAALSQSYPPVFQNIVDERIDAKYKRVFNDARLTDHHAIIPLAPLPARATDDEKKVYDLVLKRFAAAFHADCEYEQTNIVTEVEGETFGTQGKRILKPGWRAVYGAEEEKRKGSEEEEAEPENLPPLEKGDPATVAETKIDRKQTTPPPQYSDALLLKDMTNPGRYVDENELKKIYMGDIGLGTQSTRAQIIETLLDRKYVIRDKRYIMALDKGCLLIDTLRRFERAKILTSAEQTARWEMQLNRIALGEGSGQGFLESIQNFVREIVEEFKAGRIDVPKIPSQRPGDGGTRYRKAPKYRKAEDAVPAAAKTSKASTTSTTSKATTAPAKIETFGKCPRCGGDIIEGERGFGCSNWRKKDGACRFVIWKTIAGKKIPKTAVRKILAKGVSDTIKGFKSKSGKTFSARLKLNDDQSGEFAVVFDF